MTVALRGSVRRPAFQDAALACTLLLLCVLVTGPDTMVGALAGSPIGGWPSGQVVVWAWRGAMVLIAVGVTLRRRWPLQMLAVCTLAAGVHLVLAVPPMIIDLGVLILLYTVAAHCGRAVSLAALAALLLLITGWSLRYALDDRPVPGMPRLAAQLIHRSDPATGRGGEVTIADRIGESNFWGSLSVLGSSLVASWAVGSGTRNRRAYLDQLHAHAQGLERERDQQAALAVAAERGRISREMHDVVAHGLSIIVIQAQGAAGALDTRPVDARTALETIVATGRDSLADMRRVLAAMGEADDAWHPQPGLAQLPALLTQVRGAGTPVRLHVEGVPVSLPSAVDLSAYRIVQEALTNAMKHAGTGATTEVLVSYGDTEVGIDVRDDGQGTAANGGGNGLRGMRERVKLLGGRFSAGPGPEGGFRVQAILPIEGSGA